jgi:SAM-dependent methyltransferase
MNNENVLIITGGILLGCMIGLSWFAGSDAPYVATKMARIKKALKLSGKNKGKFYELGSGDGRVVFEAAKMGFDAYGIEQSILRVWMSQYKAKKMGLKNAHFIHGNIFNFNYQDADLIFIFLLPIGINKLQPKLKKELKKGSIIITQTFHFKNWIPFKKELVTDKKVPNRLIGKNQEYEGDFWYYQG